AARVGPAARRIRDAGSERVALVHAAATYRCKNTFNTILCALCVEWFLSDTKPALQRIAVIDNEGVLARNPGGPFDLGDNGGEIADERARGDAAAEPRADEALVHERPGLVEQAHRVDDRHHG